jgi:hypothetical protein
MPAYVAVYRGRAITLYGPFPGEGMAKKASYFHQAVSVSDAHSFPEFPFRVQWYDDNEIAYVKESPGEFGFSSVQVKPPKMSVHQTWRALFSKFKREGSSLQARLDEWWDGKVKGRW